METRAPAWFNRVVAALAWVVFLLSAHCVGNRIHDTVTHPGYGIHNESVAPVGGPDYPREP